MLAGKIFITDDFRMIKDPPLSICALFVAIKVKYREKSLLLLNQLINLHTLDFMFNALKSKEAKSYKITSLDISSQQRKQIISYMFAKLSDQNFYYAIIFSIGFYLTPDVLDVLEQ